MHMFWGGPFSQWYPSLFEVEGIKYNCAEQYMMAKKAELFGDEEALLKIMTSANPEEQKRIGRTVENFVENQWDVVAKDIVFRGNMAKFAQNPGLRAYMLAAGDQEIVEASPEDTIWGIGLFAEDPDACDKTKWKGTNWLGEVLMSVRDVLRNI
ncbi:MAG: NADAR family protein [Promethearchaeota archaeon]